MPRHKEDRQVWTPVEPTNGEVSWGCKTQEEVVEGRETV